MKIISKIALWILATAALTGGLIYVTNQLFSFRTCSKIDRLDYSRVRCATAQGSFPVNGVVLTLPVEQMLVEGDETFLTLGFPVFGIPLPMRFRVGSLLKNQVDPAVYLCLLSDSELDDGYRCKDFPAKQLSAVLKPKSIVLVKIFELSYFGERDPYIARCFSENQDFVDTILKRKNIFSKLSLRKNLCVPSIGQIFYK